MPDIQFLMHEPEHVPEWSETKAVRRILEAGMHEASGILYLPQNSIKRRIPAPYELRVFGARALKMDDWRVLMRSAGRESWSSFLNWMENSVSQERIRSEAGTLGLRDESGLVLGLGLIGC